MFVISIHRATVLPPVISGVADEEDSLKIWWATANILIEQPQTADKG
jgi:hypothetical protein